MERKINDWVINVATVNGSGSQSSNNILIKSLFRMGIPVGGKNLFPSNIQGLPTWYTIRANKTGHTSRQIANDLTVAMNLQTVEKDILGVKPGGTFLYNADLKFNTAALRQDVCNIAVPFRELVDQTTDSVKLKKLLTNMVYVGIVAELLAIDWEVLSGVISDMFGSKPKVIESNMKAIEVGRNYARENLNSGEFPLKAEKMDKNNGKILIEGNTAAALGMMYGGCTFVSWYPITPSSSLVENFIGFAEKHRKDENGKNTFAVVQAEDELASIAMVAGASWAGARAMTASSGPGLSLMAETAGLSYFAEVPSVLWDVQRVGPSTGLPTRIMQGDLLAAHYLSHGDTRHVLLIPGTTEECFEFGQTAFDLAERLQTFITVLSDIDLGMNQFITKEFDYPTKPFDRGKILTEKELSKMEKYQRYADVDGDAIPYRTLPGTRDPKAAFLTRGSGHNESAQYTEDTDAYVRLIDRLGRKYQTAKKYVPKPVLDGAAKAAVGIISYGSNDGPIQEARDLLKGQGLATDYLRLRALPFTEEVDEFLQNHERVYVVEQNRDGQMKTILQTDYPQHWQKLQSVLHYDGMPIHAELIRARIAAKELN